MYQTDKCVVAQVSKVVVVINFIIIDHSRMIQAFRFIEISKYVDGGQLMQGSSRMPPQYPIWRVESGNHRNVLPIYINNSPNALRGIKILTF